MADFAAVIADAPAVTILGVDIAVLEPAEAARWIEEVADREAPALVAYANAHALNAAARDRTYRDVLRRAALVLNDGSGVAAAARLWGARFPANLNGTDFNPVLCGVAARRGWPLFLLGARPGVADEAARRLQGAIPGLAIAGTHHGYFAADRDGDVAAAIRASGAAVVMAALGNPAQELWLDRNLSATGAPLGIGVGAFLDFAAGAVPRAPQWMRRAGLEWCYRLAREPGRLWRRYIVGNPLFLARAALERAGVLDYR